MNVLAKNQKSVVCVVYISFCYESKIWLFALLANNAIWLFVLFVLEALAIIRKKNVRFSFSKHGYFLPMRGKKSVVSVAPVTSRKACSFLS